MLADKEQNRGSSVELTVLHRCFASDFLPLMFIVCLCFIYSVAIFKDRSLIFFNFNFINGSIP